MKTRRHVAVVVGGAGRMGLRLARFLRRRRFQVLVADPAGSPPGFRAAHPGDVREAAVVAVAASLPRVAEAMETVLSHSPRGLVFDIASVKAELISRLERAHRDGVSIVSVHPMFGPDRGPWRGRDLIICDVGNAGAVHRVRRLFSGAGLHIRTIPVCEHDAWVARTMGLAHLIALAAASTMARRPVDLSRLNGLASTSFRRLLALTRPLLEENPALTQAIQSGNPCAADVFDELIEDLKAWRPLLFQKDPSAFTLRVNQVRLRLGLSGP